MTSGSRDVGLDEAIFGGLPGIVPEAPEASVDSAKERPASSEYYIENKVMGVPVAPEDQQLAIRESDNIQELFEPVGDVRTICFLLTPDTNVAQSDVLRQYNEALTAARNGVATILKDEHTYDPALGGYVIMLTFSTDKMVLRKEFKGHFDKLDTLIGITDEDRK